jgi:hypothetical protein
MNHLDFKGAIAEVSTAVQYLRDNGAQKVGCVGFCMGGALTFCAAQHSGVDAAAPFYGTPDPSICDVSAIINVREMERVSWSIRHAVCGGNGEGGNIRHAVCGGNGEGGNI